MASPSPTLADYDVLGQYPVARDENGSPTVRLTPTKKGRYEGIYLIHGPENYGGKSVMVERRVDQHMRKVRNDPTNSSQPQLYGHIQRSPNKFEFVLINPRPNETLEQAEKNVIGLMKQAGYVLTNKDSGGGGPHPTAPRFQQSSLRTRKNLFDLLSQSSGQPQPSTHPQSRQTTLDSFLFPIIDPMHIDSTPTLNNSVNALTSSSSSSSQPLPNSLGSSSSSSQPFPTKVAPVQGNDPMQIDSTGPVQSSSTH